MPPTFSTVGDKTRWHCVGIDPAFHLKDYAAGQLQFGQLCHRSSKVVRYYRQAQLRLDRNQDLVGYTWLFLDFAVSDCTGCAPQHPELWGVRNTGRVLL